MEELIAMKFIKFSFGIAFLCAVLLLGSCSTRSELISTWELPGAGVGPFHKVVVFALMEDSSRSRSVEMAAVDQLQKNGVDAVPGFQIIDPSKKINMNTMEKQVASTGADAVMIYKVIALDKNMRYVPPTEYVMSDMDDLSWWDDPFWGYYAPYPYHYWGYYYPAYQVTVSPGYWTKYDTYRVETVLYRTSDNRLVWTAISETYNPRNKSDLGQSLTKRLVKKLKRVKILTG